jgi:hypothetical protein
MKIRPTGLGVALLALLVGCADPMFTESDDGEIREVQQGSDFYISLPAWKGDQALRPAPTVQGAFINLTERHLESDEGREVFKFNAVGAGDAEIHITVAPAEDGSPQKDFLIRVRIKGAPGRSRSSGAAPPSKY